MQAIATLVEHDPYLKLSAFERISARRERRAKMWAAPVKPGASVLLFCMPTKPPVYRMWFDDLVSEAERQIAKRPPRVPRIAEIQSVCALHYGISRDDILSPCRLKRIVRPRQIAMYLSKILTSNGLVEIGRRFGNRDHTTGLHAIKKMHRLVSCDESFAAEIDAIRAAIRERIA